MHNATREIKDFKFGVYSEINFEKEDIYIFLCGIELTL